MEAKSNYILRTLENPSYLERYTFKSKRPHKIHLSRVPQKLSYGVFHDREPDCSSMKSQQWGSSDPLKYNNAKHTESSSLFRQTWRDILVISFLKYSEHDSDPTSWKESHIYIHVSSLITTAIHSSWGLDMVTLKNNLGVQSGGFCGE